MIRDEEAVQITFDDGDQGWVIFTNGEARTMIDRIGLEGEAVVCGRKLTDEQASELARTLEELFKIL